MTTPNARPLPPTGQPAVDEARPLAERLTAEADRMVSLYGKGYASAVALLREASSRVASLEAERDALQHRLNVLVGAPWRGGDTTEREIL